MSATGMTPGEQALASVIGTAVHGAVQTMVHAGLRPSTAFRLVGLVILDGTVGCDAVSALGLPEGTSRRWRREVRAAARAADLPEESADRLLAELLSIGSWASAAER